ncbi:DUF4832_domain-containing protein [Hexamita inflata]|uniref:Partial n=1 Tax=Hexamita inflata TaxID=28002 RepID=A0AA86QC15_9EUKA|nr:DUF4832 domain-containing protein [Hexamita inflata]
MTLYQFKTKKCKSSKKCWIISISVSLILATLIIVLCVLLTHKPHTVHFKESKEPFANPERGWHVLQDSENFANGSLDWLLTTWRDENSVHYVPLNQDFKVFGTVLFVQFNLEQFKNSQQIPEQKMNELHRALTKIRENGLKAIFRAAYNFDGTGRPEPDDIQTVLTHQMQIINVLNANKNVIIGVQFGFIGPWGEMHNSVFDGLEGRVSYEQAVLQIGNQYFEHLDQQIKIMVRKPSDAYILVGQSPLQDKDAYTYSRTARIGFHNDALYTNANDYGTFDPDKHDPIIINYVRQQTKYTIATGESSAFDYSNSYILGNYSTYSNALKEAKWQHITSQNLWSFTQDFNGPQNNSDEYLRWDIQSFNNFTCVMGYRWVLQKMQYFYSKGNFQGQFQIINVGISTIISKRPVILIIQSGGISQNIIFDTDPRMWLPNETVVLPFDFNIISELIGKPCQILLQFPDKDSELAGNPLYSVRLANSDILWDELTGNNIIINDIMIK